MVDKETLYFTKRFLSGNLKGLMCNTWISYPRNETSRNKYIKAYRKGAKGKDAITKARWIIEDAGFQNYTR